MYLAIAAVSCGLSSGPVITSKSSHVSSMSSDAERFRADVESVFARAAEPSTARGVGALGAMRVHVSTSFEPPSRFGQSMTILFLQHMTPQLTKPSLSTLAIR